MITTVKNYFYKPSNHPKSIGILDKESFMLKPITKNSLDFVVKRYEESKGYGIYVQSIPPEIQIFRNIGDRYNTDETINSVDREILYNVIMLNLDMRLKNLNMIRIRDEIIDDFIRYTNNLGVE